MRKLDTFFLNPIPRFSTFVSGVVVTCALFLGLGVLAQSPGRSYIGCNHDSLITVLRAYEDSLALASVSIVVRADYAWRVTDASVADKVYKIYRCEALYDSLEVLIEEVAFVRTTPPTVETDSIGSITATGATFYGKVTSDGDTSVTAQWFKYGLSASSLTDSVPAGGVLTPFSAVASGLANGTTYYFAAFAENVKGTSSGDTLSFTTYAAPTVDTDAATSLSATAATLNATIPDTGGAAVTATGFKYATNSALSTASDIAGSGTSSPFTGSLTGLTAATQYWAVGYATNSVGTSYGDTITFTTSAAAPEFTCGTSTVNYDGYDYTTVQIGSQCWFAENLRNDNYRNGDPIPGNLSSSEWTSTTSGAQAIYDNSGANLATYGRLYNWYAVDDARGLCPMGFHVSTDDEWTVLENFLGGSSIAGAKMKSSPADTIPWDGTNSSGFSGLPGGSLSGDYGNFGFGGYGGFWWTTPRNGLSSAWLRTLYSDGDDVHRSGYYLRGGFSVRCVQDPPTPPTVDTDPASSVTATAATLNATITATGSAAVTATGFKYATNPSLTTPSDIAGSGTSSHFTAALTGLTESTQYWAVGYATNSVGTSYGDTITFTPSAAASVFTCGTSTVTYDRHAYTTVQIGSQCWFAENLRNDNYRNGDAIQGGFTAQQWRETSSGGQTPYGGSDANLATYGRLYNWFAVIDARGLCPTGWHVPTDAEWDVLENFLGGNGVAGGEMKSSPSDTPAWNGTNSSGFSALPGGQRAAEYNFPGYFMNEGDLGFWWSSSPDTPNYAWYRVLFSDNDAVWRYSYFPQGGFSVRCVQDE